MFVRKNTTLLCSMAIDRLGPSLAVEGATIARVFETYVERVFAPNGRYCTGKVKPYGKPIASQYPRGRRGDLELMEGEEPFCYATLARGHPAPGRPARGQPARGRLSFAQLAWADLRGADLRWVDLRGAELSEAIMPDVSRHP